MNDERIAAERHQLLQSPAGCALLIMAAEVGLTPQDIVEPVTALHLVATAVAEIIPWRGDHDQLVDKVLRNGPRHHDLADALMREPGIERWWASLDRDNQIWMESEPSPNFPGTDTFPSPTQPPDRWTIYAQRPHPMVLTSTEVDGWTSLLASVVDHSADWIIQHPAQRKHVRIEPGARVYEVVTAEDWHALVTRYGVRSEPEQSPHPQNWLGRPWESNDGLVADWQAIARDWDGVHVTLWALLTALQVRVTSEAGWSEAWSWEAEETIWLHWAFSESEELPPVVPPLPEPAYFPFPIRYGNVDTGPERNEARLPPSPVE